MLNLFYGKTITRLSKLNRASACLRLISTVPIDEEEDEIPVLKPHPSPSVNLTIRRGLQLKEKKNKAIAKFMDEDSIDYGVDPKVARKRLRRYERGLNVAKLPEVTNEYGETKFKLPMATPYQSEMDEKFEQDLLCNEFAGGTLEEVGEDFFKWIDETLLGDREKRKKAASIINKLPAYQDYELETEMRLRIMRESWSSSTSIVSAASVALLHSECGKLVDDMRLKYHPRIILECFPWRHQLAQLGFPVMPDIIGDLQDGNYENIEDMLAGNKKKVQRTLPGFVERPNHDIFDYMMELKMKGKLGDLQSGKLRKELEEKEKVEKVMAEKKNGSKDLMIEQSGKTDALSTSKSPVDKAESKDINRLINLFAPKPILNEESAQADLDHVNFPSRELIKKDAILNAEDGEIPRTQIDRWCAIAELAVARMKETYELQNKHFIKLERERATAKSLGEEHLESFYATAPKTVQEMSMIQLLGVDANPMNLNYVIHDVKEINRDGVYDDSDTLMETLMSPESTEGLSEDFRQEIENIRKTPSIKDTPFDKKLFESYLEMIDDLEVKGDPEAPYLREFFMTSMKEHEELQEYMNQDKNRLRGKKKLLEKKKLINKKKHDAFMKSMEINEEDSEDAEEKEKKRGPKQYKRSLGPRQILNEAELELWTKQAKYEDINHSRNRKGLSSADEIDEEELNKMYNKLKDGSLPLSKGNSDDPEKEEDALDALSEPQLQFLFDRFTEDRKTILDLDNEFFDQEYEDKYNPVRKQILSNKAKFSSLSRPSKGSPHDTKIPKFKKEELPIPINRFGEIIHKTDRFNKTKFQKKTKASKEK